MLQRHLIVYILFSILFVFVDYGFSAESFAPWCTDVKIADENIDIKNKIISKTGTVYGGPQGAAYFMIRFFQVVISPQDGPNCKYHPTCSAYGRMAVARYGGFFGALLAGDRLLRCNPYTPSGSDPLPEITGE